MLDIETFSTRSNAAVLTIGAIKFSRRGKLYPLEDMDTFYCRINKDSCEAVGLHIDIETINWWEKQNEDAKYEVFTNEERIPLHLALIDLEKWIGPNKKIWGHGSVFDCTILDNAYRACGITTPWNFWDVRDTRTLYDIGGVKMNDLPTNNAHHAVHDAYRQIVGVKMAIENLKK